MKKQLMIILILVSGLIVSYSGVGYSEGKFSGYMFGDYYYVISHNNKDLKNQNGFWFRRIYFTYDYKYTEQWQTRLRLEYNSPGDFKTKDSIKPYIKDAYLQWKKSNCNLFLGISPSPIWEYIEGFWGYRSVEKTPLDLYKMGDSRDFGIALLGTVGEKKIFRYHLQLGNGAGIKSETNRRKKIAGSFLFDTQKKVYIELYVDYEKLDVPTSIYTYQAFLGWKGEKGRFGAMYSHQVRKNVSPGADMNIDVASILAIAKANDKISLLFRLDRVADALPWGPTQSYIPLNSSSPFTLIIAGIDYSILKDIKLIPNIETVIYDETNGVKPDKDVYLKITCFYSW